MSAADAAALVESIVALVRDEALPKIRAEDPTKALELLSTLKSHGLPALDLERQRPDIERDRSSRFPLPAPLSWPEIADLKHASEARDSACYMAPPAQHAQVASELAAVGAPLPEELLRFYAAAESLMLWCRADPDVVVFAIHDAAQGGGMVEPAHDDPRRAVVLQGGDELWLGLYRDEADRWWLTREDTEEPRVRPFDLRDLLQFGMKRWQASSSDELDRALSWDRYFE